MVTGASPHTLVVRLDSMGDVLLAGPAVRAVAYGSRRVTVLAGSRGRAAAELLPGVDEVLTWTCPWIDAEPEPVRPADVDELVGQVRARRPDRAVVFTSFHQSALPTALLLRLAGVRWVGAVSEDYPGSLLDLRRGDPGDVHEVDRALGLARAAGYSPAPDDDGRLAIRGSEHRLAGARTFDVVLHPGTSVPARAWPQERWAQLAQLLTARGLRVAVTGSAAERALTASVCGRTPATDLGGRTTLAGLADVLADAGVVVVANTGAAHLAAAVHTPVVSLFAPTVPAARWAPYRTPSVLLGDQLAPCRGTRATACPVPGHPCLASVPPSDVAHAVDRLLTPSHPAARAQLQESGGIR